MQQLLEIPKIEYERFFQQSKSRWNKHIQAKGAYLRAD
jgi:hypothetical protein